MAEILYATQGAPPTPAAGNLALWPDSTTLQWSSKDANGVVRTLAGINNYNTADEVANAADTYLAGSRLSIPPHLLQAGTVFKWRFAMTKTAAGIAAPTWIVRVGTLGTTGDAARLTFTGPAQTAAIDTGFVEIMAILRNTGAAGILAGFLSLAHNLATTGFANISSPVLQVTSAGFDTTVAGLKIGVSVNPGASGVWTHQVVSAEMLNI